MVGERTILDHMGVSTQYNGTDRGCGEATTPWKTFRSAESDRHMLSGTDSCRFSSEAGVFRS